MEKDPEKEFTLLCCNVENFRLYNDTFGRKAGDKLLKEAAAIFRKRVSDNFVCCRYSADRFLCLTDKESAYTENPEQIIITVEELRKKGFVIEMDDFGSGYSSLNMPGEMSLDILKPDMKFIRNQMAKPAERSLLKAIRCDYAQGYFYAKPSPSADYEKLLQS